MTTKLALTRTKTANMSFDMGLLPPIDNEEITRNAARLLCKSLCSKLNEPLSEMCEARNSSEKNGSKEKEKGQMECKDTAEPDWSGFEAVFAKELLPAQGGAFQSAKFLTEVVDILIDYIRKVNDRSCKVVDFNHPHNLKEILDHCLEIPETPRDLEQILSDCKETLKYGVKTGHPRFFNQLTSGLDIIAMAGEWLTAAANANMFTYEIAPVFTLMEEVTLQKMRDIVGWEDGDGIFAPGGTISNLYAVHAARHKYFPECKQQGMTAVPPLVIFTSEQSHYSMKQAGALLGLGLNNVILVKADERGKMIAEDLEFQIEKAIRDGKKPFFVCATGGTTVLGAFDPIHQIADIGQKYDLWVHVDAAWGGGVLLSRKHRHLLSGVERVDSVTWNPHKMMGAALQCSVILIKEKDLLQNCNSMCADYLFQQDKHYDTSYDTGDKAIQCGRHNDVFKLWLTWRAKGDVGFEAHIEKVYSMAEYLTDSIVKREGFELVMDKPEYTNICFWYMPTFMRSMPAGPDRERVLNQIAPKVKAMMMEKGSTMVGYQPLGKIPNFFRMVISNPAVEMADIDFLLDEILRLGEDIGESEIRKDG